jgi:hypothetical protein
MTICGLQKITSPSVTGTIAIQKLHLSARTAQVAAVQVPVDDLPKIGTEESIGPLKSFYVTLDEGFYIDHPIPSSE